MLSCRREDSNSRERYAVAVLKGEEIVGHVPRYMSIACSLFMRRGGSVYCTITEGDIPGTFRREAWKFLARFVS